MHPGKRLVGKVAIVTGGASGIGAETARVFALHGAKVLLTDSNAALGKSVASEISDRGNVIDQLVIRAWNTKAAPLLRHVMIILRNDAAGEGLLVLLRADRNSCTLTRAELQNLIDGRRQWYSRLFPTAGWLVLLKSIWSISVAVVTGMLVGLWVPGQVSVALWCALISLLTPPRQNRRPMSLAIGAGGAL